LLSHVAFEVSLSLARGFTSPRPGCVNGNRDRVGVEAVRVEVIEGAAGIEKAVYDVGAADHVKDAAADQIKAVLDDVDGRGRVFVHRFRRVLIWLELKKSIVGHFTRVIHQELRRKPPKGGSIEAQVFNHCILAGRVAAVDLSNPYECELTI
jgi:hypothetical protein